MSSFICPVCGFPGLSEPPRTRGGNGSHESCQSCGFEFGYTDTSAGFTYRQWREKWVKRGMPWDQPDPDYPPPDGWEPKTQLAEFLAHGDTSEDDVYRGVDPR